MIKDKIGERRKTGSNKRTHVSFNPINSTTTVYTLTMSEKDRNNILGAPRDRMNVKTCLRGLDPPMSSSGKQEAIQPISQLSNQPTNDQQTSNRPSINKSMTIPTNQAADD
ncbi:hypothetical protein PoB_007287700 [Plakobranchus ocellatus]|uniref:Uncharacterized protein n=1 Tax=Plakobranchus ocellatus TaxID=259542 RepID=A0AAV4DQJ7_9GAST|nr:hypothetical protein PoB_007287700 [Plakobranchus ocellatus]